MFLLQFHPIQASKIPIIRPSSRPFRMILPIFHEIKSLIWLNRHFYTDEIRCNFHCVFGSMNCHAKPIRVTQCPSANHRISRYIYSIAIFIRLTDYRNHIKQTLSVMAIDWLYFNGWPSNVNVFIELFGVQYLVCPWYSSVNCKNDAKTSDDTEREPRLVFISI